MGPVSKGDFVQKISMREAQTESEKMRPRVQVAWTCGVWTMQAHGLEMIRKSWNFNQVGTSTHYNQPQHDLAFFQVETCPLTQLDFWVIFKMNECVSSMSLI